MAFTRRALSSGFTLIELIIVMAIMGLLIGVTASSFQTSRIKGKDAKRKSDLKQIGNALEGYLSDHGRYPTASANKIVACGGSGTSTCDWGSAFTDENGTVYMAQIPADPLNPTRAYQYLVSSDGKSYQLYAALENTQDSQIGSYPGKNCPDSTYPCTYGTSSANTTPAATLP
jgi:type II secretion system protein G